VTNAAHGFGGGKETNAKTAKISVNFDPAKELAGGLSNVCFPSDCRRRQNQKTSMRKPRPSRPPCRSSNRNCGSANSVRRSPVIWSLLNHPEEWTERYPGVLFHLLSRDTFRLSQDFGAPGPLGLLHAECSGHTDTTNRFQRFQRVGPSGRQSRALDRSTSKSRHEYKGEPIRSDIGGYKSRSLHGALRSLMNVDRTPGAQNTLWAALDIKNPCFSALEHVKPA
jgi:hypothetical protein